MSEESDDPEARRDERYSVFDVHGTGEAALYRIERPDFKIVHVIEQPPEDAEGPAQFVSMGLSVKYDTSEWAGGVNIELSAYEKVRLADSECKDAHSLDVSIDLRWEQIEALHAFLGFLLDLDPDGRF